MYPAHICFSHYFHTPTSSKVCRFNARVDFDQCHHALRNVENQQQRYEDTRSGWSCLPSRQAAELHLGAAYENTQELCTNLSNADTSNYKVRSVIQLPFGIQKEHVFCCVQHIMSLLLTPIPDPVYPINNRTKHIQEYKSRNPSVSDRPRKQHPNKVLLHKTCNHMRSRPDGPYTSVPAGDCRFYIVYLCSETD